MTIKTKPPTAEYCKNYESVFAKLPPVDPAVRTSKILAALQAAMDNNRQLREELAKMHEAMDTMRQIYESVRGSSSED